MTDALTQDRIATEWDASSPSDAPHVVIERTITERVLAPEEAEG